MDDVICTSGPSDRPFEERHALVSIGVVMAGTFQYRSASGREVMTAGSALLGSPGECFECGHEHARGDRCVAFHYSPEYFERLAADAGAPPGARRFRVARVPPVRDAAPVAALASAGLAGSTSRSWEEIAVQVAAASVLLAGGIPAPRSEAPAAAVARVTDAVRAIETSPASGWTLPRLAADAGLSPFHFLRTFKQVTGVTPHQFVLRARLRQAAARLLDGEARIIEVALGAGFEDVSNFNRAFRAEFGAAPRAYRRSLVRRG